MMGEEREPITAAADLFEAHMRCYGWGVGR